MLCSLSTYYCIIYADVNNTAISDHPVPEANLNEIFDAMWPKLEEKLMTVPKAEADVIAKRSTDDMIAEILEISRAEANRRRKADTLDAFVPLFDELVPILPQIREALRTIRNQMLAAAVAPASPGVSSVSGGPTLASPATGSATSTSIEGA